MTTASKKIAIILGIVAFILVGGWYVFFARIQSEAEAVVALDAEYQEKVSADDRDRSIKQFLDNIGSSADSLSTRYVGPSQEATAAVISYIESTARSQKLGIVTNSVEIKPSTTHADTYEYLVLRLSTQGSWQDTYTFLSMLETLPYKTKINRVEATYAPAGNQSSWQGVLEVALLKVKGK